MIDKTEQEIMAQWQGDISKPVVSICSITYNHEKFIEDALDSFLMQETDFPFEIVIDDDCSTDSTAGIIKKYIEKYPSIINANLRQKNVGAMRNFVANMQRAQGEYIALCEGDDYWIDNYKLQKQVNFLEENQNYGLVCTDIKRYEEENKCFLDIDVIPLKNDWAYDELIDWRSQVWTLTSCFRKCYIVDLPKLDETYYFTGDRLLFLHLSLKSKIKFLEEKTAVYRILKQSASHHTDPIESLRFLYKLANLMLYFLEKYPVNSMLSKKVLYTNMYVKLQYAFAINDYDVFMKVSLISCKGPTVKQVIVQLVYYMSKYKIMFHIFSYIYRKRIYLPYKDK